MRKVFFNKRFFRIRRLIGDSINGTNNDSKDDTKSIFIGSNLRVLIECETSICVYIIGEQPFLEVNVTGKPGRWYGALRRFIVKSKKKETERQLMETWSWK